MNFFRRSDFGAPKSERLKKFISSIH